MPTNYAGNVSNFPVNVRLPSDGDLRNATTLNAALEDLTDRTANLAANRNVDVRKDHLTNWGGERQPDNMIAIWLVTASDTSHTGQETIYLQVNAPPSSLPGGGLGCLLFVSILGFRNSASTLFIKNPDGSTSKIMGFSNPSSIFAWDGSAWSGLLAS
jgi:hypothetical protein